jgi:hypothetical protein
MALVAKDNPSRFSVKAKTSIEAKYFRGLGAGFPSEGDFRDQGF